MDTVRDLGSSPRRLVQQWRVPCGFGSLRRPVPNLVQAAHIWRTWFEQSGPYCRSRQAKGILSVAVQHSYPVPPLLSVWLYLIIMILICDSRVRLQREAATDKAEESAQRKAVRQQMRAENANPRVRSGAAQGCSLASPSAHRRPHNRLLRPNNIESEFRHLESTG